MKNLVLGAVRGYGFEQLKPFVASLNQTNFRGDLVLLYNNLSHDTLKSLENNNVHLIPFSYRGSGAENSWSRFWPKIRPLINLPIGENTRKMIYSNMLNLAFVRFIHKLEFLELNFKKYDHVLITDVRDVFFQDDPFRDPLPASLVAFLEAPKMIYGQEPLYNDPWVRTNYNDATLERLVGNGISCCGTVMGTSVAMLDYLRSFCAEIKKLTSPAHGADTSIHNVLVREILKDRFTVMDNLSGAVGTLGNESFEQLKLNSKGLIIGKDGRPVPAIHQYEKELFSGVLKALSIY